MKPIINLDDVALEHHTHGEKFAAGDGAIAPHVGGRLLGYSVLVVPAGKRAYPFHCHHVNEEMFFIIEGSGVLRLGDREYPIRKGDVIAAPPGGRDTAHQIINTSDAELRYLAVSTMIGHEIVEYPDSAKVSIRSEKTFAFRGELGTRKDYWDGE